MKFPYPENPTDWQTAYTRDDAYRDFGKHARHYKFIFLASVVFVSVFGAIQTAPIINGVVSRYLPKVSPDTLGRISFLGAFLLAVVIGYLGLLYVRSRAFRFATTFFADFHQPSEEIEPAVITKYRLHGKFKLPAPFTLLAQFKYIIARDGEIIKSDQWPAWSARNLGGPLLLIVFDGCALYLERGNRFSRIVGPGDKVPFLEWYETIKYVVDLRPKQKVDEIPVWTKDGINIKLKIQIECRIGDPKRKPPATDLVYPYDPVAIKKAIERHSMRWPNRLEGGPSEFTWVDAAWGQVTGIIPGYISSRMLDDLFIADRKGGQILSENAVQEIFVKLNNATNSFGVYIIDFQVLEMDIPIEVDEHQREHWKAERQRISTIREGSTAAFNILSQEKAHADAQRDLILAIADGLEKTQNGNYDEPMLLLLSRMLDDSLDDPLMRAYLAKETIETLEKIKEMLKK